MSKEYSGLELKVNLSGFFVSHSVGKRVVGWAIRCFESCAHILNLSFTLEMKPLFLLVALAGFIFYSIRELANWVMMVK